LDCCRIGGRDVAVDQLDRVVADRVAVQRHIGVDAGLEVLALQREGAGERPDDADLDRTSAWASTAQQCGRQRGDRDMSSCFPP
jgi:hypothetical protein